MRALLVTYIQNAQQSLGSNRLRSTLTIVGVVIGVASMTAILALGVGASSIVEQQVDALGGNIAVVRPVNAVTDPIAHLSELQSNGILTPSTLTMHDVDSLRGLNDVSAVAPLATLGGTIVGDNVAPAGDTVIASTPDLLQVSSLKIDQGQFLDPNLNPNTIVVGPQLSVDIFGTDQSVGQTMNIRGHAFTVIGVLARTDQPINYNILNFDNVAIMNLSSTSLIGVDQPQIQQIDIKSKSVSNLHSVVAAANQLLLKNHLQQADFQILTGNQIAQPTSEVFLIIAGVTTAIAAISLLVGGIGIMNIMLVSVAERTREIGLRKALGARSSDIVWQFLIESIILSLSGGIIGYAIGYVVAFVVSTFLTFDPALNWQIAVTAIGLSLVVGTLFGIYPAIRASRKDPIKALRQYD